MIIQGVCAWWAAAVRGIEPVILSFGAAFAAIGLNDKHSHDAQLFKSEEYDIYDGNKVGEGAFEVKGVDQKLKDEVDRKVEKKNVAVDKKFDNPKYEKEWNKQWKIAEEKIK